MPFGGGVPAKHEKTVGLDGWELRRLHNCVLSSISKLRRNPYVLSGDIRKWEELLMKLVRSMEENR